MMDEDSQIKDDILRLQRTIGVDVEDHAPAIAVDSIPTVPLESDVEREEINADMTEVKSSLANCLILNHMYQEFIQDAIQDFELQLMSNRELQVRLQCELSSAISAPKKVRCWVPCSMPYFKDCRGHIPPSNEDALTKAANHELEPYVRPPRAWNAQEKETLRKAVKASSLEVAIRPLISRKHDLCTELLERDLPDSLKYVKEDEIRRKDQQIAKLTKNSNEMASTRDAKCDWFKIGVQDFNGSREANECELFWKNYLCPEITKTKWAPAEVQALGEVVKEQGQNNWEAIAKTLGTGRTDLQCLSKYQTHLNTELFNGKWTAEEDEKLRKIVESCQMGDYIPWHQVTYFVEGRTSQQIWCRWSKICPQYHKGRWTFAEDVLLLTATLMLGAGNWSRIKEFVPNRNGSQCAERWTNSLNPSISRLPWTKAEDDFILQGRSHSQPKRRKPWSEISRHLKNRTDSMVYNRYLSLMGKKSKKEAGNKKVRKSHGCQQNAKYVKRLYHHLTTCLNKLSKQPSNKTGKLDTPEALLMHVVNTSKRVTKSKFSDAINPGKIANIKNKQIRLLIAKMQTEDFKTVNNTAGRKTIKPSPVEHSLLRFFNSIRSTARIGRPVTFAKLDVTEEEYQSSVKGFGEVLRLEGASSRSSSEEIPALPPTLKTLDAFQKLLLLILKNQKLFKVSPPQTLQTFDNETADVSNHESADVSDHESADVSNHEVESSSKVPVVPDLKPSACDQDGYPELFQQFSSIFLWPAVLSTFPPADFVTEADGVQCKSSPNKIRTRKKWRKRKPKVNAEKPIIKVEPIEEESEVDGEPKAKKPKRGRPKGRLIKKIPPEIIRRSSRRIDNAE